MRNQFLEGDRHASHTQVAAARRQHEIRTAESSRDETRVLLLASAKGHIDTICDEVGEFIAQHKIQPDLRVGYEKRSNPLHPEKTRKSLQ